MSSINDLNCIFKRGECVMYFRYCTFRAFVFAEKPFAYMFSSKWTRYRFRSFGLSLTLDTIQSILKVSEHF